MLLNIFLMSLHTLYMHKIYRTCKQYLDPWWLIHLDFMQLNKITSDSGLFCSYTPTQGTWYDGPWGKVTLVEFLQTSRLEHWPTHNHKMLYHVISIFVCIDHPHSNLFPQPPNVVEAWEIELPLISQRWYELQLVINGHSRSTHWATPPVTILTHAGCPYRSRKCRGLMSTWCCDLTFSNILINCNLPQYGKCTRFSSLHPIYPAWPLSMCSPGCCPSKCIIQWRHRLCLCLSVCICNCTGWCGLIILEPIEWRKML